MGLEFLQRQEQEISPQLVQFMEILQLGALELKAYLEDMSLENPAMDLEDSPRSRCDNIDEKIEWLNRKNQESDRDRIDRSGIDRKGNDDYIALNGRTEEDPKLSLKCQLNALRPEKEVEKVALMIIESLDENGRYNGFDNGLKVPASVHEKALNIVQMLNPPGVGARDLRECLLLQLNRMTENYSLEIKIVEDHLEDVAQSHYNQISKILGVPQERVRLACSRIRSLNPRPLEDYDAPVNIEYIYPDIIVTNNNGELSVSLSEGDIPSLNLNSYYCDLMKTTDDAEVKDYLREKVNQVKWVTTNISRRRETIMRCANALVQLQNNFFLYGREVTPMVLKNIAEIADVTESTVSRAMRDKYIQCDYGVFPAGRFFSRNVQTGDGTAITSDSAKAIIMKIISEEPKKKPLSDQQISEVLAEKNISLNRRTVAKYRSELGIPPATGRKET